MRKLQYREAIWEAIDEEMARDERVFVIGEDVGKDGGLFKCTKGLRDKYGDLRCKDSPICESGIVGLGVGAATVGLRPVVEIMFCDFLATCMDQICNQAAKIPYMSGGQVRVPIVIRTAFGAGRSSAAQHSQSLHAWIAHCPGIKVVSPSTAGEAKGLLKTAIRDDNPVMFFEHKMIYATTFDDVPDEGDDVCIPFGKARLVTEGTDVSVVAISNMVNKAEKVAKTLLADGISVEVLDLRTVVPLDSESIIRSVKKTGRLLILDEGYEHFGISGEIALRMMRDVFYDLEAPVERMGLASVPVPFSPCLEYPLIPDEKSIATRIREMVS